MVRRKNGRMKPKQYGGKDNRMRPKRPDVRDKQMMKGIKDDERNKR